ncbi:MAG: peptidoglycan DD-metalloendopeptidase family protein [Actinomycetota bacterium]
MELSGNHQEHRSTGLRWHRRAASLGLTLQLAVGTFAVTAYAGNDNGSASATAAAPRRSPACTNPYVVAAGDSWWGVARKVGVSMDALLSINAAVQATPMYVGTTICLPAGAVPSTTVPATTVPATTVPGSPTSTVPSPTTTVPPVLVEMAAFPAQGPCWYTDTWQAPRGGGRKHEGVDLIARSGQYLYAVTDGTLTRQSLDRPGSLSGNAWWLTADDGTYFFYAHLAAFAPGLQVGSRVKAGQVIGWVGRTGNASSPHLHFEIHPYGGKAINPTASIRAVDACRVTEPLPQPDGVSPPIMPPVTTGPPPSTQAPTVPAPTVPALTVPALTTPAPLTPAAGTRWQFIAPKTAYDSAWGAVPMAGQSRQKIRVDQLAGVPAGTQGVIVRLTAKSAGLPGYLATYPCDLPAAPGVSQVSYGVGETSVGTSVVEVVNGSICLLVSTAADVKVEVLAAQAATGVGVQPVSASRVVDTRNTARLTAGSTLTLTPAMLGVADGTQALTASITVVNPGAPGTLSLGFCGQGPWQTPFTGDAISSFSMTMRVSPSGWCLSSTVDTDVIVDVTAAWAGATVPTAVDPVRIYDSRNIGSKVWLSPVTVPVAGVGGVSSWATTAVLSLTTVSGEKATSVFVVPCGEGRSSGSVSAQSAQRVSSEMVAVRLGAGAVCVSSIQPVDIIVDVIAAG